MIHVGVGFEPRVFSLIVKHPIEPVDHHLFQSKLSIQIKCNVTYNLR